MFEKDRIRPLPHIVDPAQGEDVADLADGMDLAPGAMDPVAERRRRRRNRVVMPVGGAAEISRPAGEGPRDHAADLHRMQPGRDVLAKLQQSVEAEAFLMAGDLKHAVSRGVADRPAGAHVFGAMFLDDRNAGGMAIAQRAARAAKPRHLIHQVLREGGDGVGEVMPIPRHRDTRQFPMPRRRVLAARHLCRRAPAPGGVGGEARHIGARGQPHRRAQPKRIEVGHPQGAAPPLLGPAPGAGGGDMAQRRGAGIGYIAVEKRIGIGRAARADAVHHDQEGAGHATILSWIRGGSSGSSSPIR